MPGRPCQLCANAARLKLAAEMIAAGSSDEAVAKRIGGISRMAVARHRQNHIERPAKAIVAAANKGKDVRDEREQIVAAAKSGDVAAAFLSLERIASDLRRVQERLERTADAAEADNQRLAVASLSAQTTRLGEVRAKLASVGGYATPRSDKGNAPPFVLTINFSGGRLTRIEGTPIGRPEDPAYNASSTLPLSNGDMRGFGDAVEPSDHLSGAEDDNFEDDV
jgi:hypothetical protein